MITFRQLACRTILAVRAAQVAEHGGITGIRDGGLPESALARPEH